MSASSGGSSGRRLCFALRPAGLAFSSGLAWVRAWPGGATGFRKLVNNVLSTRRFFLLFVAISKSLSCEGDASVP